MRSVGVGAIVVMLAAQAAGAEPSADASGRYALAWVRDEGAESCPAGREFSAEVSHRLGRSPFDEHAERAIEIRVARVADAYTSHVYLRDRSGSVLGQRSLSSAEDCAVLFSATALAVALLIDPDAKLQTSADGSQAVAEFGLNPTTPPPSSAPAPSAPVAPPPPPPPPPPPAPPSERAPSVAPQSSERTNVATTALHSVLALDLVPGAEPGVELLVSGRVNPRVAVSAGATYVASGAATHGGSTFAVGLTAFHLAGELDFVRDRTLTAGAEAGAWLGALRTSLRATNDPLVAPTNAGDFPFLAFGAGLVLRVHVTDVVFVDARALALAPLLRRRLQIARSPGAPESVWTEPPVGGFGTAGLGVSFF